MNASTALRPGTRTAVLAVTVLAVAVVAVIGSDGRHPVSGLDHGARAAAQQAVVRDAVAPDAAATAELEAARARVAAVPRDWPAWSVLGSLELERGRATTDPAAYAAAQAAYDTSLRIQPEGNDDALAGQASLAAARHDFAGAERLARRALGVNPAAPQALAALTDALTELGRYDEALAAARQLDTHRPGLASFTRLSYQEELRGRIGPAIDLMSRAAAEAATPAQLAFTRSHEGLLRLATGDPAGAKAAWTAGTAIAGDDAGLLLLGARLAWSQGHSELALDRYADLVARRPTPSNAVAQAEALAARGRTREAEAALEIARAGQLLARNAKVEPEPADVLFEADHGAAARAVTLAEGIWRRSPSVGAADAYAWALHVAGRDREALTYADKALALGGRPAGVLAHRGTIRAALGDRAGAVADLRAALASDPTFSALHAPRAKALLASLEVSS